MDKNRKQVIVLVIVLVLFFGLILAGMIKPKAKQASVLSNAASQAATGENKAPVRQKRKKSAFETISRDPFSVGKAAAAVSGELLLSGIIWDPQKPYCIIDGKVVKVGDNVSGAKVMEITRDSVTIKTGDLLRTIRVGR